MLFNAVANTEELNLGSILLKPDGLKVISEPKNPKGFSEGGSALGEGA